LVEILIADSFGQSLKRAILTPGNTQDVNVSRLAPSTKAQQEAIKVQQERIEALEARIESMEEPK